MTRNTAADPAERVRALALELADALVALTTARVSSTSSGPEPTYSLKQVAAMLSLSRSGVQRLRRRGELPAIQIGHRYVVRESDIRKFLDERESGAVR